MPRRVAIPPALVEVLRDARHVCVLTGAGVSAESGVPTFREAQSGLWAKFDPLELATPEAFQRDPETVWRWYKWRRSLVSAVAPSAAHIALSQLADLVPRFTLITQNVDGLHDRAGNKDVIEFHGNLFENRCSAEDRRVSGDINDAQEVPTCPGCGGICVPVWSGSGSRFLQRQ